MLFQCTDGVFDNGYPLAPGQTRPRIVGYLRGKEYDLGDAEIDHLISIGLFPEGWEIPTRKGRDGMYYPLPDSERYWNEHLEGWQKKAAARKLPFRPRTEKEQARYDELVRSGATAREASEKVTAESNTPKKSQAA